MSTEIAKVWNAVLAKESQSGIASLSSQKRTIYFVNHFHRMNTSGLDS